MKQVEDLFVELGLYYSIVQEGTYLVNEKYLTFMTHEGIDYIDNCGEAWLTLTRNSLVDELVLAGVYSEEEGEFKKCADLVYLMEKYWTVEGDKCKLTEAQKEILRNYGERSRLIPDMIDPVRTIFSKFRTEPPPINHDAISSHTQYPSIEGVGPWTHIDLAVR